MGRNGVVPLANIGERLTGVNQNGSVYLDVVLGELVSGNIGFSGKKLIERFEAWFGVEIWESDSHWIGIRFDLSWVWSWVEFSWTMRLTREAEFNEWKKAEKLKRGVYGAIWVSIYSVHIYSLTLERIFPLPSLDYSLSNVTRVRNYFWHPSLPFIPKKIK